MDKKTLRQSYLLARKAMPVAVVEELSAKVEQRLISYISNQKLTSIASYLPIQNEVIINHDCRISAIKFIVGNTKESYLNWLSIPKNNFIYTWEEISQKIDAIIVPLVAFNANGYRIGYGQGNYDRWLANFAGKKIGVAFDTQETNINFSQEHDQKLDVIITNKQIILV